MSASLDKVETRAFQCVVQRPDGAGFAVTSNDRPNRIGDATCDPALELSPGRLTLSDRLVGSKLEMEGGLTSAAMSSTDVRAGRWSGSTLRLLLGDWNGSQPKIPLCRGQLSSSRDRAGGRSYNVDLLPSALREAPCVQTSPECRAVLGDDKCRIDMRKRRRRVTIVASEPGAVTVEQGDYGSFAMGRVRWISGASCGLDQTIIAVEGAKLLLQRGSELRVEAGDRAILSEGCDGRRATCSERFGNILNFRGEPDMPGSEILMRFPGD